MKLGFYRAFEDEFRGDRELIKSRLYVYREFLEPLIDIYPESQAIDLGCGRGEWLELMGELGFSAQGVDLDDGMLDACRGIGLQVRLEDALDCLIQLPDESQSVVSGFHLAEHIPFDDLQILVEESLRVLKPAGLLILETPNPENIVVGSSSFYMDPTHERPIPPLLLAFLPDYYGFERTTVVRLQEAAGLAIRENIALIDVLKGVSPDYAVVAQKKADMSVMERFSSSFEKTYGIELDELAQRYSASIDLVLKHTQTVADEKLARVANKMQEQGEKRVQEMNIVQAQQESLQEQLIIETNKSAAEAICVELLQSQLVLEKQKLVAVENKSEQYQLMTDEKLVEMAKQIQEQGMKQTQRIDAVQAKQSELQQQLILETSKSTAVSDHAEELQFKSVQQLKYNGVEDQTERLNQSSQYWRMEVDRLTNELERQQANSNWLNNEWEAANVKVDELVLSSNHWKAVGSAQGLELVEVYKSMSWRVTWPLRKLMQLVRFLLLLPFQLLLFFIKLSKRLVLKLKVFVRGQRMPHKVLSKLRKYPRLFTRLKHLALKFGLIKGSDSLLNFRSQQGAGKGHDDLSSNKLIWLTPNARKIYYQLKEAVDNKENE
jgi:SAM-dependent methyltransferase